MALSKVDQYYVWPTLATGESKTSYQGRCYQWLDSDKSYAIRLEWFVAQKGSEYYKIYFRSLLAIRKGYTASFTGAYSLRLNSGTSGQIATNVSFTTGSLKPTSGSKDGTGTQTDVAYYLIKQDTFTIDPDINSSISLNGSGFNINSIKLTVDFKGAKLDGTAYNTITASQTDSPICTLPAIVKPVAAEIVGIGVTGGHRSLSVLWSTDLAVASDIQYTINDGDTYVTVSGTSGSAEGAFSIKGLSAGASYTVGLKVEHDGFFTEKSADPASTFNQPAITLNDTSISLGILETEKSITIQTTNEKGYYYLQAKVILSDGTSISDIVDITEDQTTIPLNLSAIRESVTDTSTFYVTLYSYLDSDHTNAAYSSVDSDNGTITIDYSASEITFNNSDFVLTSSTSGYTISGGTLGDKLLIRSLSQISVKLNALATTNAGSLTYTVEIRNSSDKVLKRQELTNTTAVNIGTIASAGTYSAVLTIFNAIYNNSKTVTISDIYVSEYSNPSVYATVAKTETAGTLMMTISAQYSTVKNASGVNVNALKGFKWYHKLKTASDWTFGGDLATSDFTLYGTTYQLENMIKNVTGFSDSNTYVFKLEIEDSISSSELEVNVTDANSILRILANGQIGIGAIPDTTDPDVKLTVGGDVKATTMHATAFNNTSLAKEKDEIALYDGDVQSIISSTDVYKYKYKKDIERGVDIEKIGFIIGDDYNTYEGIMSEKRDAIDLYTCIGILWKSQQKIYEELSKLNK